MIQVRDVYIGVTALALAASLGAGSIAIERTGSAGQAVEAPIFEVDPLWPRPLPNHWVLGSTIGVSVDSRDHVWIIHRHQTIDARTELNAEGEAPTADCCATAPPVLELDPAGNVVGHWGGPGDDAAVPPYRPGAPPAQQFRSPVHCAPVANDGLVYVCDRASDRIQVFRRDGTFVKEALVEPETLGSGSTWDIAFSHDPQQRYIYLADGSNKKVHVLDRETLQVLTSFVDGGRQPGQFIGVHSIAVDSQGNIYTTETYEGKRLQKFVFRGIGRVPRDQGVVWPRRAG